MKQTMKNEKNTVNNSESNKVFGRRRMNSVSFGGCIVCVEEAMLDSIAAGFGRFAILPWVFLRENEIRIGRPKNGKPAKNSYYTFFFNFIFLSLLCNFTFASSASFNFSYCTKAWPRMLGLFDVCTSRGAYLTTYWCEMNSLQKSFQHRCCDERGENNVSVWECLFVWFFFVLMCYTSSNKFFMWELNFYVSLVGVVCLIRHRIFSIRQHTTTTILTKWTFHISARKFKVYVT